MSKTIILVRHGKSDWSLEDLPDYDRPLKYRGFKDACKMARKLQTYAGTPELLYTSPANRALYTCIIFSRTLFQDFKRIEIREDIYLASAEKMLNLIQNCDNRYHILALFGHNPGITDLANYFLPWHIDNVPTAGFVRLEFDTEDWAKTGKRNLTNQTFDYPKKMND